MSDSRIVCPTCGKDLSTQEPLWRLNNVWYCSERCLRTAAIGTPLR